MAVEARPRPQADCRTPFMLALCDFPSCCRFPTRCPLAQDVCAAEEPPLRPVGGQLVACHFA